MDWMRLLRGTTEDKYIVSKESYEELIYRAVQMLSQADAMLIGAGAGLSTAAGLTYGGDRFTENFQEFIQKYGSAYMTDMYSAGFYPFPTEEKRWGYWSKHVYLNRIEPNALPLYRSVYQLTQGLEHFVLTTNVDHQFWKAGFRDENIFATQGDYGLIQCAKACHSKTYQAVSMFERMNQARKDCKIPSSMVPKCPVCGGPMSMNLRCDQYFVEDEKWHQAAERYEKFLMKMEHRRVVLLELGVGFNTPVIIRFPFEEMTRVHETWSLIRLNLEEAMIPASLKKCALGIPGNLVDTVGSLLSYPADQEM
ncbi:MAG: SIR2 family NAD-dependent protein deacylase [Blautia sp.]|jgi:NAD-dependent SIR2 family protein deacetylase